MKFRKRQQEGKQGLAYLQGPDDQEEIDDDEIKKELLNQMHGAIENLPKKSRRVMRMSLAGKRNIEIAQELNLSIQTVKNQKTAALKVIKIALLKKDFPGDVDDASIELPI